MLEKNCADMWNVLGYFHALTATASPQYRRQILRWWERPAEDFSVLLFSMPTAGELVLPCLLPCPQMHPAWRDTPAFSQVLSSLRLCILWGSAPIKWCPQGTAFALSSVLCWGFLPSAEFSHIWESLFTSCIYWNHCKSVHLSQWAVSSERQWQSCEDELCGEVPTPGFRYRISIMISPGFPHSYDDFCLPALTHSLNLCKTYPLYQMRSPFWELFLLCCCIQQLHTHWLPFPSPTKSSSNLNWVFLLETRQAVRLKASFPSPCWGLVHRVGHVCWCSGTRSLPPLPGSWSHAKALKMFWLHQGSG